MISSKSDQPELPPQYLQLKETASVRVESLRDGILFF
jgi:hypothetical protein